MEAIKNSNLFNSPMELCNEAGQMVKITGNMVPGVLVDITNIGQEAWNKAMSSFNCTKKFETTLIAKNVFENITFKTEGQGQGKASINWKGVGLMAVKVLANAVALYAIACLFTGSAFLAPMANMTALAGFIGAGSLELGTKAVIGAKDLGSWAVTQIAAGASSAGAYLASLVS